MSLNIRHLTNGEKTVYVVYNNGVEPPTIEFYDNREDIDVSIRHYVPTGEALLCRPDMARILGILDLFYPEHPNCVLEGYKERKCIAESCCYLGSCELVKGATWNTEEIQN